MPRVEDIFSILNLHVRYHHIPLNLDSIPKTAFISPFGKYKYLKVPFWLAQAPAYFQKMMNKVLKDLPFAIAYLDDIIIYSKTAEEHLDHLQQVFHKLCNAELTMKLSKCHFFPKGIQHLGHVLSTICIKPLPSKTAAIKLMIPSKNGKQVRAFLWLVGYYHKLIKNFAQIAKLLMEQEVYGICYAVTKRNYYLQGSDIVVCNEHKPLQRFLIGKSAKTS